LGNGENDRVTPTVDLAQFARGTEQEVDPAPTSNPRRRRVLSPAMVPRLVVTLEQLRELPIDPRAAYLVSLVDGQCSVLTIADVAGVPEDEVLEMFGTLLQLGAVDLGDP
jgi:hypothetical protein